MTTNPLFRAAAVAAVVLSLGACSEPGSPLEPSPPEATVMPVARGELEVGGIEVESGSDYELVEEGLAAGARRFVDARTAFVAPIPAELQGRVFIRTANADRNANPGDPSFLSFQVDQAVTVYVVHDDRVGAPAWLAAGFTDTGLDLYDSDPGSAAFSVFRSVFPAGMVTLGANADAPMSPSSMYTVVVDTAPAAPDTVAPSVPSGLSATAVSDTRIDLMWSASADAVGVAGYYVYRDGSEVAEANDTTYADTGLSPSTTYSYTVAAHDAAGNVSGLSTAATATTEPEGPGGPVTVSNIQAQSGSGYQAVAAGLDAGVKRYIDARTTFAAPVPPAVEGLTFIRTANGDRNASPGDASFLTFDVDQSVVVYVAHDDRVAAPAWLAAGFSDTGLDLQDSDPGSGAFSVYSAAFPGGTVTLGSNTDAEVAQSAMYTVIVEGSDGGGAPDTQAPTAPTDLTASAVSSTAIDLGWVASTDDVGVSGYHVYRDGAQVAYVTATAHSDTGLDPSTTYTYTVTADDAAGNVSAAAEPASATTDAGPGPGPGGAITGDPSNRRWLFYEDGSTYFLAGAGGPENFLYRGSLQPDGTRSGGDQQQIIDALAAAGVNGLYMMAVRSHGGDGGDTQNPWVGSSPSNGLDQDILDQWEGWFASLDEAGITIYFIFYDDGADPFGGRFGGGGDEGAFIADIVDRFKHHDHLIWVVAEEYSEAISNARALEIAATIRARDPVHPAAIHLLPGTSFPFSGSDFQQFAVQATDNGIAALHATMVQAWQNAAGGYNLNMSELNNTLGHANHSTDQIRQFNWASALAGAYVMVHRWWEPTGEIPSATELAQLGYLRAFMESVRFDLTEPADHRAAGDTEWVLAHRAGLGNDHFIGYGRAVSAGIGFTSLDAGTYDLTWLDPATGQTVTAQATVPAPGAFTFPRPPALTGSELALYARKAAP